VRKGSDSNKGFLGKENFHLRWSSQ